jgi:small subunit ribosomal protein S6
VSLYDLMLLLDPNAPEARQNEVLANTEATIEAAGTIVGKHDWGVRHMAYEIDHRPDAAYHLFQFETEQPELLTRLGHSLKIADGVLRHRIIRLKPGSPPPPAPRPEPARARDSERRRPDETRVAARAAADAERPAEEDAETPAVEPAAEGAPPAEAPGDTGEETPAEAPSDA